MQEAIEIFKELEQKYPIVHFTIEDWLFYLTQANGIFSVRIRQKGHPIRDGLFGTLR